MISISICKFKLAALFIPAVFLLSTLNITAGYGTYDGFTVAGDNYAASALTSDSKVGIVYLASTGTITRTVTNIFFPLVHNAFKFKRLFIYNSKSCGVKHIKGLIIKHGTQISVNHDFIEQFLNDYEI